MTELEIIEISENLGDTLHDIRNLERNIENLVGLKPPSNELWYFEKAYYREFLNKVNNTKTYNTLKYTLHNTLIALRFEHNILIDYIEQHSINQELAKIDQNVKNVIYSLEQKIKYINKHTSIID